MVFVAKDVLRIVFRGGFFGGRHCNHPNTYLNCTIILFDLEQINCITFGLSMLNGMPFPFITVGEMIATLIGVWP